ncbi:aminodeoxychorismate synthase component I [Pedobacter sp. HMF7647]|uniref:aminodeoxychorismate synthase n=1 Tax=Hufsiella arboris TaxID=2695275 RepID=A0A7K1Y9T0_9SPHI|nr:aminodeoxychorismate synthase component I [Hufsiella arboris]MXV51345.1 aminodeoxychorismate synthase component I [Hufsiella arboris]
MTYKISDLDKFKKQVLKWATSFDVACYFDSNQYSTDPYSAFDLMVAAGTKSGLTYNADSPLQTLQEYISATPGYKIGYLSYDLKNDIEDLSSANSDHLGFPKYYFFEPQHILVINGNELTVISEEDILQAILEQDIIAHRQKSSLAEIKSRIPKEEYISSVSKLQEHIHRGDIYEANFCQEFYSDNAEIDPLNIFLELIQISPTPFSTFFKLHNKYILSSSPERFLRKRQNTLISQPIKGTAKRGKTEQEDTRLKMRLFNDEKERAENVMIVDLVRNDLTKCAVPGSVKVEELFGVYSFRQVHQMISTVSCEIAEDTSFKEILEATFPMGSMTGAPKISAMKLIEKYEKSNRGVYSGSIGYIAPNGDFDFNVIIRSILYNSSNNYLSFQVGGAITAESVPEREFEECLLKAEAMMKVLKHQL